MHPGILLTDLYELTMLQAYFRERMNATAVFECFVRKLPPHRNFLVAAGLAQAAVVDPVRVEHEHPIGVDRSERSPHPRDPPCSVPGMPASARGCRPWEGRPTGR